MKMDVKEIFRKRFGFSQEMNDTLEQSGYYNGIIVVDFKKKQIIIHEGDHLENYFFLISGVVRWYYLNEDGNELTTMLMYEYGESVVPSSYYYDMPSQVTIQVITDVQLIKVPKLILKKMLDHYPEIYRISMNLLADRFLKFWQFRVKIVPENTMFRYQWFVKNHGALIGRITDKYIASYLAMTPATLSRVQKRYREMQ